MSRTVFRGLKPAAVRAAYDKEPNKPEPPVPDDQVEITFLETIKICDTELKF